MCKATNSAGSVNHVEEIIVQGEILFLGGDHRPDSPDDSLSFTFISFKMNIIHINIMEEITLQGWVTLICQ